MHSIYCALYTSPKIQKHPKTNTDTQLHNYRRVIVCVCDFENNYFQCESKIHAYQ